MRRCWRRGLKVGGVAGWGDSNSHMLRGGQAGTTPLTTPPPPTPPAVLRGMYGTNGTTVPQPKEAHVTRWYADEFARSSYSFYAVGNAKNITGGRALRGLTPGRGKQWRWGRPNKLQRTCPRTAQLHPPACYSCLAHLQARWPSPLGACCLRERRPATSPAPCWGRT